VTKNKIKIKKKQIQRVDKDPIDTSSFDVEDKPYTSQKEIHIGGNNLFYEKITWEKFKRQIKKDR